MLLIAAIALLLVAPSAAPAAETDPPILEDSCIDQLRTFDYAVPSHFVEGVRCNTRLSEATLGYVFKGWANVDRNVCGSQLAVQAWRWTGTRWQSLYLAGGSRIYVWPFAADWSWVWKSTTGWVAMRDHRVILNQWSDPRIMCAVGPGWVYVS